MGACVMGSTPPCGAAVIWSKREIKRVFRWWRPTRYRPAAFFRPFDRVRRSFSNTISRTRTRRHGKGVSARAASGSNAETLAIQYTIELRQMLKRVGARRRARIPVHVWADVLAMTAVKFDLQSEETKAMKARGGRPDLVRECEVSREERAEVIRVCRRF